MKKSSLLFAVLNTLRSIFSLFRVKAYLQQAANGVNRATLLQLKRAECRSSNIMSNTKSMEMDHVSRHFQSLLLLILASPNSSPS